MANSLYDAGREEFLTGGIDYSSDTIKMALMADTYTPNVSTDQFWSDVSSNVIGTPQTLSSKTATNGVADCSDVMFTGVGAGNNVDYIVLYKDTGTPSSSTLIALYDTATGLPFTSSGADIVITIDTGSDKLFKL